MSQDPLFLIQNKSLLVVGLSMNNQVDVQQWFRANEAGNTTEPLYCDVVYVSERFGDYDGAIRAPSKQYILNIPKLRSAYEQTDAV